MGGTGLTVRARRARAPAFGEQGAAKEGSAPAIPPQDHVVAASWARRKHATVGRGRDLRSRRRLSGLVNHPLHALVKLARDRIGLQMRSGPSAHW